MLPDPDEMLRPAEVAALFRVSPKTVTRWADEGRVSYVLTPGGHRRFPASQFVARLQPRPITRPGPEVSDA